MRPSRATPAEAATIAVGIVATLGVIVLAVFPALGWIAVVTTPLLAAVAATVAARGSRELS